MAQKTVRPTRKPGQTDKVEPIRRKVVNFVDNANKRNPWITGSCTSAHGKVAIEFRLSTGNAFTNQQKDRIVDFVAELKFSHNMTTNESIRPVSQAKFLKFFFHLH